MTTGYNYLVSDDTDDIDWLPPVYTFLHRLQLCTGPGFMFYFKGRLPHGSAITICWREPGHVSRDL